MHNIDVEETAHFEAMADCWWNPTGPCRPLHDLNPTRLQFITDRCSLIDKQVLDVGCGGGILTESMARRGARATGLDASEKLIQVANDHAKGGSIPHHPITYLQATVEAFLEEQPTAFDVITCLELLEHVPDPVSIIETCAALLKPGGDLFLSTLNRTPKAYVMAIIGAEYILKLLPKNTHDYKKFIRPSELDRALRAAGLAIQELKGLSYNPFSRQAKLTPDVSINYLVHVKKPA